MNRKPDLYDSFSQIMIIFGIGVSVVCVLGALAVVISVTPNMTRAVLQPRDYTSTPLYECAPTCIRR